jgi:hypothetical protein
MSDLCASCSVPLPERSPASPGIRYCQDDWWREQLRAFKAAEVIDPWVAQWFTTERTPLTRGEWVGAGL